MKLSICECPSVLLYITKRGAIYLLLACSFSTVEYMSMSFNLLHHSPSLLEEINFMPAFVSLFVTQATVNKLFNLSWSHLTYL